jgi:micrococcal nuclease
MAEPVCKVVDGDTFHFCDGVKIRLSSIDAPERGEPYYWESRRALAELLQGGQDLKVTDCHTDSTGKRQACGVFLNGKDIQGEMVSRGMAWDWPKYSKGLYAKQEKDAKTAKAGLWVDEKATSSHWSKHSRY